MTEVYECWFTSGGKEILHINIRCVVYFLVTEVLCLSIDVGEDRTILIYTLINKKTFSMQFYLYNAL